MGADVSISIEADGAAAEAALSAARDTVRRMERLFSLYDPASSLSRLNRSGSLKMPMEFARLVQIAGQVHALSGGWFDPTVQPLFSALSKGAPLPPAAVLGWPKVKVEGRRISMPHSGMALTFNGIAQGFATDRVSEVLKAHGFTRVLANVGEYRAGDEPALLGVADPEGSVLQSVNLRNAAIATSSPGALRLDAVRSHILAPDGAQTPPVWATVSVVAETAALADGFSTALALAPDQRLASALAAAGHVQRVFLQGVSGRQTWIG